MIRDIKIKLIKSGGQLGKCDKRRKGWGEKREGEWRNVDGSAEKIGAAAIGKKTALTVGASPT